jgi:KDO2-lipid IV(A) lauroyltransferase
MRSPTRTLARRDLRVGERWTYRQRVKNDAIFLLAAAALSVLPRLGKRALDLLGAGLGDLAYFTWPAGRRQALRNVSRVWPDADTTEVRRRVRSVYRTLGRNLADALSLLDPKESAERSLTVPVTALTTLDNSLDQGRGVVFVTGHLGPWERMACALAARGRPITAVVRGSYDPRFDRLVYDRLRRGRDIETIDRSAKGAGISVVHALRRGRVVGFLIDLPGRVPTMPATLFDLPTRVPIGPARIALATRAPVVVGTPAQSPDGGLGVRVEALNYEDLEQGPLADRKLAQRMLDALGRRILALADHWPWMHPSFEEAAGVIATPHPDPIDCRSVAKTTTNCTESAVKD